MRILIMIDIEGFTFHLSEFLVKIITKKKYNSKILKENSCKNGTEYAT